MNFNGNWVDLVILIVLFSYVLLGLKEGFWALTSNFLSFIGSLAAGLKFYPLAAKFFETNFAIAPVWANALGFFTVAVLAEAILGTLFLWLVRNLPAKWLDHWANRLLGVVPALLDGLVVVSFFLVLLVILPVSPSLKKEIVTSKIGGTLVARSAQFEQQFNNIFGGAVEQTLTFLTVKPTSEEKVDLHFQTDKITVDEASETKMFSLVNQERQKNGLKALVWDPRLVMVARQHSEDMFRRGYFAHLSPEGANAVDRLRAAGIRDFTVVGENLAYAPSVTVAHSGLMNSPGHRANILSPDFGRVGIGVIDGGIYGKMFTQVFIN